MKMDYVRAFTDNYIWLLINEERRTALCVDPGEAEPVIRYVEEHALELKGILLTHHHADHSAGVPKLVQHYPGTLVFAAVDSRLPLSPNEICDQEELSLEGFHFQRLSTAGHTATHVCFYEVNQGLLFSGDTLFSAGCGRIFDGSGELLYESLMQLKALPDETKVYCGHEYTEKNLRFALLVEPNNLCMKERLQEIIKHPGLPSLPSTIGLEKQINPFLRLNSEDIVQYALARGAKDRSPLSVFKQLRQDKDVF